MTNHPAPSERAPPAEDVPVDRIVADSVLQVRRKTDEATVKRYAQAMDAGASFPPITLVRVADNPALFLADGFHRLAAAKVVGSRTVAALVTDVSSLAEARWLAGKANLKHGLALKPAERREVFRAFIRAKQHHRKGKRGVALMSLREIGRELGQPHTTIRNWLLKDFPKVARQISGELEVSGSGGHIAGPSPEERAQVQIAEAADAIRAAQSALTDPADRGQLVATLEALLSDVRAGGQFRQLDF